ncbi:MAG: hypothetical protein DI606_19175 [Sphingobium sp.]|uniref:methyltransferase domain-containing protein n=1 Tax=Sphingobium sp. TaxID=1912891 RepID=UPI000DB8E6CB|nr:glycosyltransferase family 2 protein [Sphingobium sp.]PZU05732.1 MAG: hypothetical protein DI606_19175 [Sphingobium sp.]PZU77949.1 MAG: hypothetical protein DI546_04720 [Rhizobium sp.]
MDRQFFLPTDYISCTDPTYYDDTAIHDDGVLFQPEIMPLAELLLAGTSRKRLVDVGTGNGSKLAGAMAQYKLGIDYGSNLDHCRSEHGNAAEWFECDLGQAIPQHLLETIGSDDVLVCSDVIEHLPDPRPLLDFLRSAYARGALVITSTPERILVRGSDHMGPPPNPAHVREWSLPEYRSMLCSAGLPPLFIGLTINNDRDRLLRTIVSVHEPRLQAKFVPAEKRPLAIISTFNEADIIEEVVERWIHQGCDIHVLDNWSTDATWKQLEQLAVRFGSHMVLERFPADEPSRGSWIDILTRKEEIAFCHKGRWIIHSDADEIRTASFCSLNISDACHQVEMAGWNRIDFTVLNHRPINNGPFLTGDALGALPHFEFGTKPGHFIQKKAWLQGQDRIALASSGGHEAQFAGAHDCPYKFVLHHFPLRSVEHAKRKILRERYPRWSEEEFDKMGWHHHYDDMDGHEMIWNVNKLAILDAGWWERHGLPIISGLRR